MADEPEHIGLWPSGRPVETSKAEEVIADKNIDGGTMLHGHEEELHALRAEIARLQESIQQIVSSSKRIANAEYSDLRDATEAKLKENVFLSIGIAAFVGYLWGRWHR